MTLTDKQRETVNYWFKFCNDNNRWPSIAEYCRDEGMPRSTAVGRLMGATAKRAMEDNPYIISRNAMRELRDEQQLKDKS